MLSTERSDLNWVLSRFVGRSSCASCATTGRLKVTDLTLSSDVCNEEDYWYTDEPHYIETALHMYFICCSFAVVYCVLRVTLYQTYLSRVRDGMRAFVWTSTKKISHFRQFSILNAMILRCCVAATNIFLLHWQRPVTHTHLNRWVCYRTGQIARLHAWRSSAICGGRMPKPYHSLPHTLSLSISLSLIRSHAMHLSLNRTCLCRNMCVGSRMPRCQAIFAICKRPQTLASFKCYVNLFARKTAPCILQFLSCWHVASRLSLRLAYGQTACFEYRYTR